MSLIRGVPLLSETSVRFGRTQTFPLRKFDGFTKQHRSPSVNNHSTNRFVGSLVKRQLESTLQSLHSFLRQQFGLKRIDLETTLDEIGTGILESPVLRFESTYRINPENLDELVHEIWLDEVPDLNVLAQAEFEKGFGHRFCVLEIPLATPVDIQSLIDGLETLPEQGSVFSLDYPYSGSRCDVSRTGSANRLIFETERIRMESPLARFPKDLALEFSQFEIALAHLFS